MIYLVSVKNSLHDKSINADSRQLATDGVYSSSKEACDKYRVNGINEKY